MLTLCPYYILESIQKQKDPGKKKYKRNSAAMDKDWVILLLFILLVVAWCCGLGYFVYMLF